MLSLKFYTVLKNRRSSTAFGMAFIFITLTGFGCLNAHKPFNYGKNAAAGNYAGVNGIKIYYEIYGEGEPLVLIHGNGASIAAGREQIDFFSKHFKVIAIDSRGQGQTKDNGDSLTYDEMAGDVNALLGHLHIDSAYIIGHSDGGIIGLITAIRYPAKVKMLAVMSPNTRPDSAVLYPKIEADGLAEFNLYQDSLKAGHKEIANQFKLLRLMQFHPHISAAELGTIKAPVLVLTSDRDVIQLPHIIEIFRAIPKANLCVMPGTTHLAPIKNAAVYNENIYRFFTQPFAMPEYY
ncbi:MAG: alpha/beta hydrolase [Aquabacterium sp.]|nr:alpha/beta hydrolase [Ferruginibacter sp.]